MPKVSVIIPIYNVEEYLNQCIESVVNQNFKDIEILLIDDGSKDRCPQICDEWSRKDSRIKVIHKPNGGLSDARNAGLDIATGEYIYFLDGDDYVDSAIFSTLIPHMDAGNDIVIFRYYWLYGNNSLKACHHLSDSFALNCEEDVLKFFVYELLWGKYGWEAWGRIYKKSIIDEFNIRFADNKKIYAEDLYFSLCYTACCKKIKSLPNILYYYRQRENSITALNHVSKFNEFVNLSKEVELFYKKNNFQLLVNRFSLIVYFILKDEVTRFFSRGNNLSILRKTIKKDVKDIKYLNRNLKNLKNNKSFLTAVFGEITADREIFFADYLRNGNYALYMLSYLREAAVRKIKSALHSATPDDDSLVDWEFKSFSGCEKRFWVIGTDNFGNVGDLMIAECMLEFLSKHFPDYSIKEVCASEYGSKKIYLRRYINNDDIIIMCGGGNFGNVYPGTHDVKCDVVKLFPENKKIVYYTPDEPGEQTLKRDINIFTRKNRVVLSTREKVSYDFAAEKFDCKTMLIPDIVLSYKPPYKLSRADRVLFCMRSDEEKLCSDQLKEQLVGSIGKEYSTEHLICKRPEDF